MADLHGDLAAIADEMRASTYPLQPSALRARSDRRRRRRIAAASTGLVVLAVAGTAYLGSHRTGPAPNRAAASGPAVSTSPSAPGGIAAILAGRQPVRIVVQGTDGAVLALGADDDDRVHLLTGNVPDDRARWILRPQGHRYQIALAARHGASEVCMTVVHDQAPGTVRDRVCDAANPAQLFAIAKQDDGTYSIFNGKRYVQGVDGVDLLVPDLGEGLTTTYKFQAG